MGRTTERGCVTRYQAERGIAYITLIDDRTTTTLPAGAFFSGRCTRLPREGDLLDVTFRDGQAVLGRLVE